jgi:hypothetical protein
MRASLGGFFKKSTEGLEVEAKDGLNGCKFQAVAKVEHPKYYKHLEKGAHQSHLGRQKMGWFLAD